MKITDITESYYDVINKRIKKSGGRDLDHSREWYQNNKKEVEKRMAQSEEDPKSEVDESGTKEKIRSEIAHGHHDASLPKLLKQVLRTGNTELGNLIRKRMMTLNKPKLEDVDEGKDKPESTKFNPVAKHMNTFNKSSTQKDKKKAFKKGDVKHKGSDY